MARPTWRPPTLGRAGVGGVCGGWLVPALGVFFSRWLFLQPLPLTIKGPWWVPSHGAYTVCVQIKVHQRFALSPPVVLTLHAASLRVAGHGAVSSLLSPTPSLPQNLILLPKMLRPPALREGWEQGSGWGRAEAMGSAWGQPTPQ